ncbi:MAG: type II secretion system protein [Gemmatimonadaceae bacterium]
MKRNTKGFTLIELLIVVVIIGILAAIAIPKFAATKERAYVASMKTDLRNIVTAEEGFAGNNGGAYKIPASDSATVKALGIALSTGNTIASGAVVAATSTAAPGWNATMTSTNTGKTCYIFVGGAPNLAPTGVVGAADGAPACTP